VAELVVYQVIEQLQGFNVASLLAKSIIIIRIHNSNVKMK